MFVVFKEPQLHPQAEMLSNNTNTSSPQVALLFLSKNELYHEAVWRAFFEAAGIFMFSKFIRHESIGRLKFRYRPPDRPYESFIYGDGKELFEKINEVTTNPTHLVYLTGMVLEVEETVEPGREHPEHYGL